MLPRAGTVVGGAVTQLQKVFREVSQRETRSSPKELSLEERQERRGKEMALEDCIKDKRETMWNNNIDYKRS